MNWHREVGRVVGSVYSGVPELSCQYSLPLRRDLGGYPLAVTAPHTVGKSCVSPIFPSSLVQSYNPPIRLLSLTQESYVYSQNHSGAHQKLHPHYLIRLGNILPHLPLLGL